MKNNSMLPVNKIFLTQSSRLVSSDFNEDKIVKIISVLIIQKAHGHDGISIRMIKICDISLLQPLIAKFK